MRKSRIHFEVELDEQNIPERMYWDATDKEDDGLNETKSISISVWDHFQHNTMRIDLWTKDMSMDDQKRFYIDCIGGLAQSILTATGDAYMAEEINALCEKFITHVRKEQEERRRKEG
ncbi:gliding motility protein GldC [Cesiribacter andamanensis]|uniref:Gliding motility-associated protein GldC n=1 Tax=Cesiribacter andamanensis AMV16 TaxID=1279009 RepID=M7NVM9_9BACT|nr:gliding motility protein GldC [Cesiribacter andamanensis]EMR02534.1 gliding motility-associated protein GldC [Cesiribacter andamanensis AMV16]